MSDEKTEEATPRRKQKERSKGNVPKSQDLNSALTLTIGVTLIAIFSKSILSKINVMLYECFTNLNPKNLNTDDIYVLLGPYFKTAQDIILPFLVILMVSAYLIVRYQVGKVFAVEKIKINFENIAPSKMWNNAKKMLNPVEPRNLIELAKSIAKILVVFFCGYTTVNGRKDELFGLLDLDVVHSFEVIGSIMTQMVINMCLAMIIIGLIDKKYQTYEYNKSLKMSKQDIKEEYKNAEGDPKIKARIRSIQMKMARQAMLSNVAKATVVVTNPTHYAVALEYNKLKSAAPVVVAKGVDFLAFKIREIAVENKVPIIENPPLARELYKLVPIDGIIPADMFVAVAEVLAFVYNKNSGKDN